ncbi:MAG: hypothetical protein J2P31_07575 [Blastocatellia bacterium]|nr:hypothetical protein [Blastocatellia bacterium]
MSEARPEPLSALLNDNPLSELRRFARARERGREEFCDFCSAGIASTHRHLIETDRRQLVCVCEACAILFGNQGKYRRVPRRTHFLRDFRLTEAQWQSLLIPIQLAFIFYETAAQRAVALYPSPAGPTESWLEASSWAEIMALDPALQKMEPDVEALLINRMRRANNVEEYYIAPIDECFRLSGLLRVHWRGLSGGARVWEEIARFFLELKQRASG